jgi:peptidyl-prolyl cis-trans isomerase B (cyclophilin B)
MRRTLTALLTATTLGLAACGDDEADEQTGTTGTQAATAQAAPPPATTAAPADGECRQVSQPAPKGEQDLDVPEGKLDAQKRHTVTMETSCGSFTITLDVRRAPKTASAFAGLTRDGFFDGLTFHRIVPGFVIQGGDPNGDGSGGPGFSVVEAPPEDLQYTRGVVAMAKTQIEDPGTSGSQFFVVTGPDAGLPAEYALVGKVTSGLDVVDAIAGVPTDPSTERPEAPVVIEDAELRSR